MRLVLVLLLGLAALCNGCRGSKEPPLDASLQDDYVNVLVMYNTAFGQAGAPPTQLAALESVALPKFQQTIQNIKSERLVVVWGTPVTRNIDTDSKVVLAFEKTAMTQGGHVQMVDAPTRRFMSADDLKAALEKNPAWMKLQARNALPEQKESKPNAPEMKPVEAKMTPEQIEVLELHLLARIYQRACENRDRAPMDFIDLEIGGMRQAEDKGSVHGVRDGVYICVFGVDTRKLKEKDRLLLAWHKDTPAKGGNVVTVSGEVKRMSAEEFKSTPRIQKSLP